MENRVAVPESLEAGDVVWVEFDPAIGHEQAGRRPALVVSSSEYNQRSNYIIVCPISRNAQPWPFKVLIPENAGTSGAILVDQVKSIDREQRVVRRADRVPERVLSEVRSKLAALMGIGSANTF
ncbi:MAG: type II toxin-antitoxin system PemK/MazF family toxin [Hyphomicrobiaceae bacterium]|nr:type II toxin-antitoxin system PemK/MazF family toxin [Hyphomicrobiaceae bacterium]